MKQEFTHTELAHILTSITEAKQMSELLQDFLTPQELEDLVLRWEIIKLLHKGLPQREIAKELGVAIGTVSRGARELKYGHNGFVQLLKTLDEKADQ
ncbi:MAG: transcriptional regulator [Candidatus Marinimicrobia bacterium]|jgi:TrpR family transcriptional regulator, trp operon repressor|nr:transcriptional regulator [Candidatus Neomarinimicrobiota bacterium]MBT3629787.1 transcriptional regulator [Candidatus Neomarinimicrobiota bacterium]MBT3823747.1 transcriptional regulator [Candidatus Neomarinimicrobiota bacterium]MBT4132511.1 transcriptional regulator [Candidatus Neomarinimicrobiota bacterium]MBT4296810.1 transcriptional regulator [Candidatus Neomarinimicrobiota bacterium]